jgi:hypothetical protein
MPELRALTLTVTLLIGSLSCFLVSSVVAGAFLRLPTQTTGFESEAAGKRVRAVIAGPPTRSTPAKS